MAYLKPLPARRRVPSERALDITRFCESCESWNSTPARHTILPHPPRTQSQTRRYTPSFVTVASDARSNRKVAFPSRPPPLPPRVSRSLRKEKGRLSKDKKMTPPFRLFFSGRAFGRAGRRAPPRRPRGARHEPRFSRWPRPLRP